MSEKKTITVDLSATTLNLTALDFNGNFEAATAALRQLRAERDESGEIPAADLRVVVFPEATPTGPGCADAFLRPRVLRDAANAVLALEPFVGENVVAAVGTPIAFNGAIFKAVAVIVGGRLRGFVCSTFLPNDGRDEARQFSAWPFGKVATITVAGREFPIGDFEIEERGVRFAVRSFAELSREVGERVGNFFDPALYDDKRLYAVGEGAESSAVSANCASGAVSEEFKRDLTAKIVLVPAATPFEMRGQAQVRRVLEEFSRRFSAAVVYSNPVGVDSGATIYDGGSGIVLGGEFYQNVRFPYAAAAFATNRVEISDDGALDWSDPETCELGADGPEFDIWEVGSDVDFEEFSRAASLGILDYAVKSRARGLTLSLSGGADSAAVALLVRLGVKFGWRQLGPEGFFDWLTRFRSEDEKFAAFPEFREIATEFDDKLERLGIELAEKAENEGGLDPEAFDAAFETALEALNDEAERKIVGVLLTTAYQSTRNSGETTRRAAREIATFCGAKFYEFDVDPLVEGYKKLVADATGKPFSWATDDATLQNVQARTRGPSVWLLANREGRLLLSTGNRSEVACGYATMDGDTCGGLAPIGGVDKAFIREWLRWLETTGVALDCDDDGAPIRFKVPAARFINEQQPTAELRPAEAKQTDEADLMPYSILNLIERALIRDRLDLETAARRVADEARELEIDVDEKTLSAWLVKFCRYWTRSQWKRGRYAFAFRLDDYDLSPNSWTKFPNVSGGFEAEIAEFEKRVDG